MSGETRVREGRNIRRVALPRQVSIELKGVETQIPIHHPAFQYPLDQAIPGFEVRLGGYVECGYAL